MVVTPSTDIRHPLADSYHRDHLGSTRTVTTSGGTVIETYHYDRRPTTNDRRPTLDAADA